MSTSTTRTAVPAQKIAAPTITSVPAALLQRQCACGAHAAGGECENCKKTKGVLSRKASGLGSFASSAASDISALSPDLVGETLRSPGQPLDRDTRAFMESRFQHDFSAVRVHTDVRAAASARALQARAWALGSDVAFATGAYAPGTPAGRRLLAHELAHVVQQAHAPTPTPGTSLNVSEPGDASEREAETVASRVAEGTPVAVRSRLDPDVVQRDQDDSDKTWTYIGIGAGAAAVIAAIIYLATRKSAEDIDHPPDCGPRQNNKIVPALSGARDWAGKALDRVRAFKARPQEAANQAVGDTLKRRFRSADRPIVDKVERVIVQVRNKVVAPELRTACHTKDSLPSCSVAEAFVAEGSNTISFCASFFKRDDSEAIVAVIHEMTHTLVGGQHIGDRGYKNERRFGGGTEASRMSTEESLSNAESYAECIADLATGKTYGEAPPADELVCPDDWKEPIKESMARAQRASINISSELAEQSAADASTLWTARWTAKHIPGDAPTVAAAKKAYEDVNTRLGGPVRIVCKPNARDRCKEGDLEWDDQPPMTLTLCATWKPRAEPARTVNLLAGLYGWLAKVDKAAWRTGLAEIAVDTLTSDRFGPPRHEDVFGSAAWTPDLLRIHFTPIVPKAGRGSYEESGTLHQRLSDDMPSYSQPDCNKSDLPLQFTVLFAIDKADTQRPGPFTPPRATVKYSYPKAGKPAEVKDEDASVRLRTPGMPVATALKVPYSVTLDSNGTFIVDVQLDDPDSGTQRKYHDEVKVEPVTPCADAAPATPQTPGAPEQTPEGPAAAGGKETEREKDRTVDKRITVQRAPDTGTAVGIGFGVAAGAAGIGVGIAALAGAFSSKKKADDRNKDEDKAKTPPQPQTAAAPLPKISFNDALEEGATVLKPGFGTATGSRSGLDPDDGYDAREWREEPSRGATGLAISATTSSKWVAVDHMIKNIGKDIPKAGGDTTKWRFDCFEGVHVLRLYAYWRTMSQAEFDKKFPTLEIGFDSNFNREWKEPFRAKGPGKKPFVEGPPEEKPGVMNFLPSEQPAGKSWATLLTEAPIGSQVIWTNRDAQQQCAKDKSLDFCAFQNENATKLGPDRYWAHPFGTVNEQTIKDEMSKSVLGRVSRDYIAKNIFISALRHPKEQPQ
jgi:hypothetical protein